MIASALSLGSPKFKLTIAVTFFRIPNDLTTGIGILSLSPPILKFYRDLWV